MRTDADNLVCVRDPTIELLLSHTATLTDERCRRRPVDNGRRTAHSLPQSRCLSNVGMVNAEVAQRSPDGGRAEELHDRGEVARRFAIEVGADTGDDGQRRRPALLDVAGAGSTPLR
jgi:hypothetical protein